MLLKISPGLDVKEVQIHMCIIRVGGLSIGCVSTVHSMRDFRVL